jgi:signal transduction histidine kinase
MLTQAPHGRIRIKDAFGVPFLLWLRSHRGAVTMAGLLAFAVPVTFLPGAVAVMRDPTLQDVTAFSAWLVLFGLELWGLLIVLGYVLQRLDVNGRYARTSAFVGACAAAALTEFFNGRGDILVEQGVVQSSASMHAYGFVSALIMTLLFFAHLHRSRAREQAAARLSMAQAAQRETRQRLVQARLQALQARIDPQLLFEMLDSVRCAYQQDGARAERLLDELVDFLRAALPRLRNTSSTVQREAQLARAYAQLRALAGAAEIDIRVEVAGEVADARFPPGVVLPLLDDALRARAGPCELLASRRRSDCEIVLTLPACPLDAAVARVQSLLWDIYGKSAQLTLADENGVANVTVKVPYEYV